MAEGRRGAPPAPAIPRWLPATALAIVGAALAVSAYLAVVHYTTAVSLVCSDTGTINCAKVTSSTYSKLAGVPLPVLGLAGFALMGALNLPAAWRSRSPAVRLGRLLASGLSVAYVLYLVYAELVRIDAICIWCTVVHVLTLALFCVIVIGTALTAEVDGG